MPRIANIDLSWASAVYKYSADNGATYEYGNRANMGVEYRDTESTNYYLYFTPGGSNIDWRNCVIQETSIQLKIKKKSTVSSGANQIMLKIYNSKKYWGTAQQLYNIVNSDPVYKQINAPVKNTLEEQELVVPLTGTDAEYAAQYGFALVGGFLGDVAEVTGYAMEVSVSDRLVPPVVELTGGSGLMQDGVFYQYPDRDMVLSVKYKQEMNFAQIALLTAEIRTDAGFVGTYEGTTDISKEIQTIPIDKEAWCQLPTEGILRISAMSSAMVLSEVMEYRFVVAKQEVRFTKPVTGEIVQDDAAYTVRWESKRPEGYPDAISILVDKYKVAQILEDGTTSIVDTTSSTSYTIPKEVLRANDSVAIAVADVYLDANGTFISECAIDAAPYVRLYVQHTASVGGVSVSGKYQESPALWSPFVKVAWESVGQTAYRVRVGDVYDSGPIWGDDTEHKVPKILEDGTHAVQIMVQDGSANWGKWTDPVWITVKNPSSAKAGTLRATRTGTDGSGVMLSLNLAQAAAGYTSAAVYRNGVLIAQIPVQENTVRYIDNFANGLTEYKVYCVHSAGDGYDSTARVEIDATPKTDGIFTEGKTWLPLQYSTEFDATYATVTAEQMYPRHYAGREFPIYMRTNKKTRSMTLTYAEKRIELGGESLSNLLEKRVGETVFFRNTLGMRMAAVLSGVSPARGWRWNVVSLTLQQIDHDDEILYTWPEG